MGGHPHRWAVCRGGPRRRGLCHSRSLAEQYSSLASRIERQRRLLDSINSTIAVIVKVYIRQQAIAADRHNLMG